MVDPVTSEGRDLIEYMKLFLDHQVPARMGLLLLPSDDVGATITHGFSQLTKSPREAFKWLVKVCGLNYNNKKKKQTSILCTKYWTS